jgi:PAS domain S-box-containing protein
MPLDPELLRSRDWLELVVEGTPSALLIADGNRRILSVNRHTEALFGYPREELIGQHIELLIPARYRAQHPDHVRTFLQDPNARPMGAGRELFGVRRNGTEVPIEIGLNPLKTAAGLIILASIIDITERRRAETAQQEMAALVESAEDAILTKGLDGIVRSWNPGAERLLGYSADEMIGQPVTRLLPADRLEEETMIIDRIRRGQRVAHFETIRRRRDGSLVDVSLTISPIRNSGGIVIGASKIMRDISERKRQEDDLRRRNAELQQMNKELDEFVYTASHDLRSPLNGVHAVAQWILEDDAALGPESRSRLALIQRRIERMKALLNDIRDYARAGRMAKPPGPPVTAKALVAEVASTTDIPAGFSVNCDPGLERILVSRVPLEQVLHNLIGNAIKHHDRADGNVTISAQAHGQWHRFSVVDDGPGIPEPYRLVIFDMFKTLKARDEVEGSGMGLAIVRKLVEKMGGHCGVEPANIRGANFWFDWPGVEAQSGAVEWTPPK